MKLLDIDKVIIYETDQMPNEYGKYHCPEQIHKREDRNPSLRTWYDRENDKGRFKCDTCGASDDAIGFVRLLHPHWSFRTVVRQVERILSEQDWRTWGSSPEGFGPQARTEKEAAELWILYGMFCGLSAEQATEIVMKAIKKE